MYEKRCAVIVAGTVKEALPSHIRRHSADILDDHAAIQGNPAASRLTLCDFLIKPVQRICRYPMLLAQLLDDPEEKDVVSRALKAMKDVAALVDEARRQKDIATKSKLIIERTDTFQVCHLLSYPRWYAGSLIYRA